MPPPEPRITIQDLTMAYGSFVIQHDLTFSIQPGEIFIIMGGSGCGKSTLLRHLIGLMPPAKGDRAVRWRELLGRHPRGPRAHAAALWGAVPERGVVEFHDPGGERRPAPGGVHRSQSARDSRGRRAQTGAGGTGGL